MSLITGRKRELSKLARDYRVAKLETDSAIVDFLQAINSPRSLAVWMLYHYNEHVQMLELKVDPLHYNDAFSFRDDYAATEFLSKSKFLRTKIKTDEVAYAKFLQMEEQCRSTNSRFRNLAFDPLYQGSNVWLLNAMTRKIATVLDEFSPDEFVDEANWGPGVSTLVKGEEVSAINKFHGERGITRGLYSLVGDWFHVAYPLWFDHLTREYGEKWYVPQDGNCIVTVPKNSKTDRVIAIEPGINLWFQKAIGSMIRKRLRRRGIDLQRQEVNQQLSKQASKDGLMATVDFSSASDTISLELVREVIPHEWFLLLNAARSHYGVLDGKMLKWEKFSSMGNGFTFELESLIFWAAAEAVKEYLLLHRGESLDADRDLTRESRISVYGDDVLLPSSCYELFRDFTAYLGFTVNPKKSYYSGNFRESCGAHWFAGIDVKPIFLKERLNDVKSIYKLANSIRWLSHRRNSHCGCDRSFLGCWRSLLRRVPKPLRLMIPASVGDNGFASNFDEAVPVRAQDGIEGYLYSCLIETGVNRSSEGLAVLLARLKVPSIQEYGNTYTLRGRTRLRLTRSLVQQWYNFGPWL